MADIKPTAQSLLNGITNDLKSRGITDGDENGSQFLEIMTARVTASTSSDSELKDMAKQIGRREGIENAQKAKVLRAAKGSEENSAVSRVKTNTVQATSRVTNTEKTASTKNVSEEDLPVEDTRTLEALKEVAQFLIDASAEGKINLPKEMVQKLQQFVAKGDDLQAADIAQFMQDFNAAFRNMIIAMPTGTDTKAATDATAGETLQWPPEVIDAMEKAGIKAVVTNPSKPLSVVDVMRTVKELVDESKKAAVATIEADKAKNAPAIPSEEVAVLAAAAASTQTSTKANASDQTAAQKKNDIDAELANLSDILDQPTITELVHTQDKKEQTTSTAATVFAAAAMSADTSQTTDVAKEDATPSLTETYMKSVIPDKKEDDADKTKSDSSDKKDSASGSSSSDRSQPIKLASIPATPVVANIAAAIDVKPVTPAVIDPSVSAIGAAASNIDTLTQSVKAAARTEAAAQNTASGATQQIIAHIKSNANKTGEISVQLTPAELGRVEVRLTIQRDGQTHAVITVDKQETLSLMQKDASHLARALQDAGLNANSENMSFNLRDGNQAQQFNQNGRKRFSRETITEGVSAAEASINAATYEQLISDNRVNYHA